MTGDTSLSVWVRSTAKREPPWWPSSARGCLTREEEEETGTEQAERRRRRRRHVRRSSLWHHMLVFFSVCLTLLWNCFWGRGGGEKRSSCTGLGHYFFVLRCKCRRQKEAFLTFHFRSCTFPFFSRPLDGDDDMGKCNGGWLLFLPNLFLPPPDKKRERETLKGGLRDTFRTASHARDALR